MSDMKYDSAGDVTAGPSSHFKRTTPKQKLWTIDDKGAAIVSLILLSALLLRGLPSLLQWGTGGVSPFGGKSWTGSIKNRGTTIQLDPPKESMSSNGPPDAVGLMRPHARAAKDEVRKLERFGCESAGIEIGMPNTGMGSLFLLCPHQESKVLFAINYSL
jgi:hypothetical protein